MTLQRLVLDYRTGELVVRCLYRSGAALRDHLDLVMLDQRGPREDTDEPADLFLEVLGLLTGEHVGLGVPVTVAHDPARLPVAQQHDPEEAGLPVGSGYYALPEDAHHLVETAFPGTKRDDPSVHNFSSPAQRAVCEMIRSTRYARIVAAQNRCRGADRQNWPQWRAA